MWQFLPGTLVFVGAVLVATGTYWTAFPQSNFNAQLRQKNEEIISLQKDSVAASTGGDAFAIASFTMFDLHGRMPNANDMPDELQLQIVLINKGRFPLYDVSVRFTDLDQKLNLQDAMHAYPVGNMASGPDLALLTAIILRHVGKQIDYNIFFSARNGLWTQMLRMRWVGNGWTSASRVLQNGKEVFSEVSQNYPRGPSGEIEWDPGPPSMIGTKASEDSGAINGGKAPNK